MPGFLWVFKMNSYCTLLCSTPALLGNPWPIISSGSSSIHHGWHCPKNTPKGQKELDVWGESHKIIYWFPLIFAFCMSQTTTKQCFPSCSPAWFWKLWIVLLGHSPWFYQFIKLKMNIYSSLSQKSTDTVTRKWEDSHNPFPFTIHKRIAWVWTCLSRVCFYCN